MIPVLDPLESPGFFYPAHFVFVLCLLGQPWDLGTHPEPGYPTAAQSLAQVIVDVDADGFNGDTMVDIPFDFYEAALKLGKQIVLEPEVGGTAPFLKHTLMSWGYWPSERIPYIVCQGHHSLPFGHSHCF